MSSVEIPLPSVWRAASCERPSLFPWTPSEVVYWVFAWVDVSAYGQGGKSRKRYQSFLWPDGKKRGLLPAWDGVTWVLQYPDLDEFVLEQLDDADRRRHCHA